MFLHRHPRQMRAAFTLIELLVVIAIIAILAAILFPVFAQAREKARAIACLNNCKQMGTATMMYVQDNDEGYPTWDDYYIPPITGTDAASRVWDAKVAPYVKMGDPANLRRGGVWHCPDSELSETYRSYGINQALIYDFHPSPIGYRYITSAQIVSPSEVVFVGDGGSSGRLAPPTYYQGYCEKYVHTGCATPALGGSSSYYTRDAPFRHTGNMGANYVFCDGHAKFMKADTLYPHPPPPSAAYSSTNNLAYCSQAKYFEAIQEERDWAGNLAKSLGNTGCTW